MISIGTFLSANLALCDNFVDYVKAKAPFTMSASILCLIPYFFQLPPVYFTPYYLTHSLLHHGGFILNASDVAIFLDLPATFSMEWVLGTQR